METGARFGRLANLRPAPSGAQRTRRGRLVSGVLFALGTLFVLAAAIYAVYFVLNTWMMGQNRYLRADDVAAISLPARTWTPSPVPRPTLPPTFTPEPTPIPSPTPVPTPTPPPRPVQIRIPALGIKRSIVKLPRVRDRGTGAWTWNTKRLFRSGRSDLVGHWDGSAYPGQKGNMVLVGHNYGYGYSGVFVRLRSLKPGQKVYVVNQAGQTFAYQVKSVNRVKWRSKNFGELTRHLSLLSPGGPERVTLVSCAGAEFEPFPERIYVVAEPVNR